MTLTDTTITHQITEVEATTVSFLCLTDRREPSTASAIETDTGVGYALANIVIDATTNGQTAGDNVIHIGPQHAYDVGVPTSAHQSAAWMLDTFTHTLFASQNIHNAAICVTGDTHHDVKVAAVISLLALGVPIETATDAVGFSSDDAAAELAVSTWWGALNA